MQHGRARVFSPSRQAARILPDFRDAVVLTLVAVSSTVNRAGIVSDDEAKWQQIIALAESEWKRIAGTRRVMVVDFLNLSEAGNFLIL